MHILFWNMGRKESALHLAAILAETPCDIVLLCEYSEDSTQLVARINAGSLGYREESLPNSHLRILTTLSESSIKHVGDFNRTSYWTIDTDRTSFTLCGVHLVSGREMKPSGQNQLLGRLRSELLRIESRVKHDRTLVIGDFNLNPYDEMIMSSEGLHALSSYAETQRRASRTVQGEKCPFFYNPMWSFLGDRSAGPAGTYFWPCSQPSGYGWNMLDQVLFRPSLLKSFADFKVDILTMAGKNSLLKKNGRPNQSISDHLPLHIHLVTGQTP